MNDEQMIAEAYIKMYAENSPNSVVAADPNELAKQFGLLFNGTQEGFKHLPALWLFTDPNTGSTISLNTNCGAAELEAKLQKLKTSFGV
tara:strand:- start:86 stop:352 length:267 start_codon:yes stop_codon:yes gene_type:complete